MGRNWNFNKQMKTTLIRTSSGNFSIIVDKEVYIGEESTKFAKFLSDYLKNKRKKFNNGIDIGSATGIYSFVLSKYCKKVIGTEIDKKSITNAVLCAEKNNIRNVNFEIANLFPRNKEKYDIIVSNPDYILENKIDKFYGGKMLYDILNKVNEKLSNNGVAIIVCTLPIMNRKPLILNWLNKIDFKGTIKIKEMGYFVNYKHYKSQKSKGIDYFCRYFIVLEKSKIKKTTIKRKIGRKILDNIRMNIVKAASNVLNR